MRPIYFIAGLVMLCLGIVGVVLPLLPATPFLLAAAWLFGRSSPRLEHWLLNHRLFGAILREWQQNGAIAPRTKIVAVACMALSFAIVLPGGTPVMAKIGIGLILVGCAGFIISRPTPGGVKTKAGPALPHRQSVADAPRS